MQSTAIPLKARYPRAPGPAHADNPMTLALPAVKTDDEWLDQLMSLPAFDEVQLQEAPYLRSYFVAELKEFFNPSARHLILARRIDQMLRAGYRNRNPILGDYLNELQHTYDDSQRPKRRKGSKIVFSALRKICTYSLIGMSGMGKSTTAEVILASYPQYILHESLAIHQVVWLKVECPKDGSVKEMALNIVRAFDTVLGTSHAPSFSSRVTLDDIMAKIKQLKNAHFLGLLALDEIQNVSVRKSGGREELLNFFQELVNEFKVPVFIMGTFKALDVLQLDARHSRRGGIMGSSTWRPLTQDDEFDALLEMLWAFQWLREPGELTQEFKNVVFAETQGVVAFIIDMFLVSQLSALSLGKETLTPELFRAVARKDFEFLQPLLNAMRSKQPNRLKRFSDVETYDVDELIHQSQTLIQKRADTKSSEKPAVSMVAKSSAALRSTLGISDSEARVWVESVLTAEHKTHSKLTSDALKSYFLAQVEVES